MGWTIWKVFKVALLATLPLVALVVAYFVVGTLSRDPLKTVPGVEHASLSRQSCVGCHQPIANEWRESFHYQSLTGPFWSRIRRKGFDHVFNTLRVPCVNCHAPANVLDLPAGSHPQQRSNEAELGVDCVSCHVTKGRIAGPGRSASAPHEVVPDERFQNPMLASTQVCAPCHDEGLEHAKTVSTWQQTEFAAQGITCLDCHMPEVDAPSVTGGERRRRRSHRFAGDKSDEMLRSALNASLTAKDGEAVLRIVNDRLPHSFPAAGTNWLFAKVSIRNESGHLVEEAEEGFGTLEWIPGYLDFWPFVEVSKIPVNATRELRVPLRSQHGTVLAEFRYRDWFALKDQDRVFFTLAETF